MRVRTVLVLLAILLLVAFAAINWPVFVAPTQLSLLVTSFTAPFGLLMLGLVTILMLAFVAYMAAWQGQILMESRRHAKELERQRTLADQAEASRFTELRGLIHTEVEQLSARLAQVQEALRTDIRENANSLAASLAEMDDRLRLGRST
ncbi:MAG: LapA family protein [Ramlibacter sp.]